MAAAVPPAMRGSPLAPPWLPVLGRLSKTSTNSDQTRLSQTRDFFAGVGVDVGLGVGMGVDKLELRVVTK